MKFPKGHGDRHTVDELGPGAGSGGRAGSSGGRKGSKMNPATGPQLGEGIAHRGASQSKTYELYGT